MLTSIADHHEALADLQVTENFQRDNYLEKAAKTKESEVLKKQGISATSVGISYHLSTWEVKPGCLL